MKTSQWIANLFQSKMNVVQERSADSSVPVDSGPVPVVLPSNCSFFHISHAKAATQWMRGILRELFGRALVEPEYGLRHLWGEPIKLGRVYACANVGRWEFESMRFPGQARSFVIIRDLRDTLVSAYYSFRNTHETVVEQLKHYRWLLPRLDPEEGLHLLAETWLPSVGWLQRSWLQAKAPCFKMEDCVADTPRMLGQIFGQHWGLELDPTLLEAVSAHHCFTAKTYGRAPGQEDLGSHYRKGIAGDWRTHFTPCLAERFEYLYGDLLLMAGYEKEPGWSRAPSFKLQPTHGLHPR